MQFFLQPDGHYQCNSWIGIPAANCGALGLPLLLGIVAVAIIAGVATLRRLMLPRPGLTAFLGVCFMLLVVVGLLSDRLLTPWSLLV